MDKAKLSKRMRGVLETTRDLIDDSGWDGYCPRNIGQRGTVAALMRRGLLRHVGDGALEDCSCANGCHLAHPIYALTEEGRRVIESIEPPTTPSITTPGGAPQASGAKEGT